MTTSESPAGGQPVAPPTLIATPAQPVAPAVTAAPQRPAMPLRMSLRALDRRATALGYSNAEEMIAALENGPTPRDTPAVHVNPVAAPTIKEEPPVTIPAAEPGAPAAPVTPAATPTPIVTAAPIVAPPRAAPATPAVDPDEALNRRLPENVRRRMAAARDEYRKREAAAFAERDTAVTQAQTYEKQLALQRAEESQKLDLVRAGIQDLDIAWAVFCKTVKELLADQTPEGKAKLAAFDAKAWALEQRKTRPYLFGETPVPATTGAAPGTAPGAPTPSTVSGAAAGAGAFNGRTASREEMAKRMKEMGISYGGSNAPPMRGH